MNSLTTLYGYVVVLVSVVGLLFLRPRCDMTPGDSFFNDETGKFVQILDLSPKHLRLPFFRLRLFDFKGIADYEVSVFDCGSYETILRPDSFKVKSKGGTTKVYLKDKSILRDRDIPQLKVTIEKDATFRDKVRYQPFPDHLEFTNENAIVVRNFAATVQNVPDADKLRRDPKVYDVYPEEGHWIVRVKEIPAMSLAHQGKQTIWF